MIDINIKYAHHVLFKYSVEITFYIFFIFIFLFFLFININYIRVILILLESNVYFYDEFLFSL